MDYEPHATIDADMIEIPTPFGPIPLAVDADGTTYASGHLHAYGCQKALEIAVHEHVPMIQVNAIEVLFPIPWLLASNAGGGKIDLIRVECLLKLEMAARGRSGR